MTQLDKADAAALVAVLADRNVSSGRLAETLKEAGCTVAMPGGERPVGRDTIQRHRVKCVDAV